MGTPYGSLGDPVGDPQHPRLTVTSQNSTFIQGEHAARLADRGDGDPVQAQGVRPQHLEKEVSEIIQKKEGKRS